MSIKPLPPSTIHLLGSSQVLTTPTALVKELVDNALDARATSIDILIAQNTLDKIEVRDNGHGIPVEDLDSLGRRGHTSKLRSFDELRTLGGLTLGFRGEALASATEMGEVSVTTRVEGEPIATLVKLKARGGIAHQSRASHPHGTTVSVMNFMANLPVRKQTALKGSAKTLARIKVLLQSYALARPSIRFGLKVHKGNKGAWSFAPRPNDGIREAVSQVIGRDAALQCTEKFMTFPIVQVDEDTELAEDAEILATAAFKNISSAPLKGFQLSVKAFLPKSNADPSKVGGGQYISIDQRPVSHEKGTMKKIVAMFKKYVTASLDQSSEKSKNPFLRLSITCPAASYDPNVEPAKDDVLFGDEKLILDSMKELFKEVYGEHNPPSAKAAPSTSKLLIEKLDAFELLLNRRGSDSELGKSSSLPKHSSAIQNVNSTVSQSASPPLVAKDQTATDDMTVADSSQSSDVSAVNKRKWNFDMSTDYSERIQEPQRLAQHNGRRPHLPVRPDLDMEPDPNAGLNPWIIAKTNAPIQENRSMNSIKANDSDIHEESSNSSFAPTHMSAFHRREAQIEESPSPEVGAVSHANARTQSNVSPPIEITNPMLYADQGLHRISLSQQKLTTTTSNDDSMLLDEDVYHQRRPVTDFISARQLPQESFITPPPTASKGSSSKRTRGPNKPFINPVKNDQTGSMQDGMRQAKLIPGDQLPLERWQQKEADPDLAWAMDFEQRKEEATRRRREELRPRRTLSDQVILVQTPPRSSPHRNRYNAAIAELEVSRPDIVAQSEKEHIKTSLPHGDPRAYLMRRQKSMTASSGRPSHAAKLKRMKTNLLPLENIPESAKVYNLVQPVSVVIDEIRKSVLGLAGYDSYVTRENNTGGLDMNSEEAAHIVSRIREVTKMWVDSDTANQCEVTYDFRNLVKGKSPASA